MAMRCENISQLPEVAVYNLSIRLYTCALTGICFVVTFLIQKAYDALRCDTIQYNTIRYNMLQCDTIRCDRTRCDTIRCDTIPYQ